MNAISPSPVVPTKPKAFTVTLRQNWKGVAEGTFLHFALRAAFQTYFGRFHSVAPDGRLTMDFVSSERSVILEVAMETGFADLPIDPDMLAQCVDMDDKQFPLRRWSLSVRRYGARSEDPKYFDNDFIFLRDGFFFLKSVAERKSPS